MRNFLGIWILASALIAFGPGCGNDDEEQTTQSPGSSDDDFQTQIPDDFEVQIRPLVAIPDVDLWVDVAEDAAAEDITYSYVWYRNGDVQDFPETQTSVAAHRIGTDSFWEVEVTPYLDGVSGPTATAERRVRPTDQTFAAGGDHACRISLQGVLRCWGSNTHGQLGDGSTEDRATPTEVAGGGTWLAVAAGAQHTCGVKDDHTLWCWGHNRDEQAGRDADNPQLTPNQLATEATWDKLSAGDKHTCGIQQDRTFWCWGDNFDGGQLGQDHIPGAGLPVQVGRHTHWLGLSLGHYHSCGFLSDGKMACWGDNGQGQIGVDSQNTRTARYIGEDRTWQHVSAGGSHSCGVTTSGELWCWGDNSEEQLGTGDGQSSMVPVRVGDYDRWYRVAAGADHTCALRQNRSLWCWGSNSEGQVYSGSATTIPTPVQVGHDAWAAVLAGDRQTCAIQRDGGGLECWGTNVPR